MSAGYALLRAVHLLYESGQDPAPYIPSATSNKGRKPSRRVSDQSTVRVDQWLKQQPEGNWQTIRLRKGEKGELRAQFIEQSVWVWDKKEAQARRWRLLVRRELDSPNTFHFVLSNAPERVRIDQLAKMHGQRFWIERAFQNAKSECGMADYQVRRWSAWYHHMALSLMAQQFMLEERIRQKDAYPMLSHSDIEQLLRTFLPRRDISPDEVVRQIEKRHQKRRQVMENNYIKQSIADKVAGFGYCDKVELACPCYSEIRDRRGGGEALSTHSERMIQRSER